MVPMPDFTNDQMQMQSTLDASQETYEAGRRANVGTLKQMFPALDEDVLEGVLEGCGDDLGVAIDRSVVDFHVLFRTLSTSVDNRAFAGGKYVSRSIVEEMRMLF